MGNLNNIQPFNFKFLCITLFLLFLFLTHTSSSPSPSSNNQEIQPQDPSSTTTLTLSHYHQVFYLKNKDPTDMFETRHHQGHVKKSKMKIIHRRNNNNNKMMMIMKKHKHKNKNKKKRTIMVKNNPHLYQTRPFSVMLPKGFIPPSGSSPCHNVQPNSVSSFHCHLTNNAEP